MTNNNKPIIFYAHDHGHGHGHGHGRDHGLVPYPYLDFDFGLGLDLDLDRGRVVVLDDNHRDFDPTLDDCPGGDGCHLANSRHDDHGHDDCLVKMFHDGGIFWTGSEIGLNGFFS